MAKTSDCKHPSASDKRGREVEDITRRVRDDTLLRNARNGPQIAQNRSSKLPYDAHVQDEHLDPKRDAAAVAEQLVPPRQHRRAGGRARAPPCQGGDHRREHPGAGRGVCPEDQQALADRHGPEPRENFRNAAANPGVAIGLRAAASTHQHEHVVE